MYGGHNHDPRKVQTLIIASLYQVITCNIPFKSLKFTSLVTQCDQFYEFGAKDDRYAQNVIS